MHSKKTIKAGWRSYKELVFESLRESPQEGLADLHESLKDENPIIFLVTVEDILQAYDGVIPEEISCELARLYLSFAESNDERFQGMQELIRAYKVQLPLAEFSEIKTSYTAS